MKFVKFLIKSFKIQGTAMNITVNGKEYTINQDATVLTLLKELGVESKTMAVAINMEIVKKQQWQSHSLKSGDRVELLHFVGGG